MSNLVVLRGVIAADPIRRDLPDGHAVVQFDLTTSPGTGVPVAWHDPSEPANVTVGTEIVVVGVVRRRFFRVAGSTQSRTEVVAEVVVAARRRRRVADLLARAAGEVLSVGDAIS
jgi:single-stranded DNA-binding protein